MSTPPDQPSPPADPVPREAQLGAAATAPDEEAVLQGLYGPPCDGGIYHGDPDDGGAA